MTDRELSIIIEELFVDDAVDMIEEMPANIVSRIMKSARPETRAQINRFLSYPDDSAGSVMTAEFIELRKQMTCAQAIARIRKTGIDKETVYVGYVTDNQRKLEGTVALHDLLFADPDEIIGDIMDTNIVFLNTLDSQEEVANKISKYDLLALPIVDKEDRLVGIVTVDDALDVIENEATEDIEKMAAMTPTDKPYMRTGVFETWKKRFPWLLIIMISAIFTSTIIQSYENALGTYAILTAFVPMLMNTGGNAGSQASVAIIRALSLDEVNMRDVLRVLWKEFRVSLLCGVCIAAACFIKTMTVDFLCKFTFENIEIGLIVSATVFTAIVIAKLIGSFLPIGAKRIGLDPAVMATPLIATIVDTVTLIIYFAIASRVLGF
jgi:magnesium transporter